MQSHIGTGILQANGLDITLRGVLGYHAKYDNYHVGKLFDYLGLSHVGTVSSPNHTFSCASLTKRLTSTSCTYFLL